MRRYDEAWGQVGDREAVALPQIHQTIAEISRGEHQFRSRVTPEVDDNTLDYLETAFEGNLHEYLDKAHFRMAFSRLPTDEILSQSTARPIIDAVTKTESENILSSILQIRRNDVKNFFKDLKLEQLPLEIVERAASKSRMRVIAHRALGKLTAETREIEDPSREIQAVNRFRRDLDPTDADKLAQRLVDNFPSAYASQDEQRVKGFSALYDALTPSKKWEGPTAQWDEPTVQLMTSVRQLSKISHGGVISAAETERLAAMTSRLMQKEGVDPSRTHPQMLRVLNAAIRQANSAIRKHDSVTLEILSSTLDAMGVALYDDKNDRVISPAVEDFSTANVDPAQDPNSGVVRGISKTDSRFIERIGKGVAGAALLTVAMGTLSPANASESNSNSQATSLVAASVIPAANERNTITIQVGEDGGKAKVADESGNANENNSRGNGNEGNDTQTEQSAPEDNITIQVDPEAEANNQNEQNPDTATPAPEVTEEPAPTDVQTPEPNKDNNPNATTEPTAEPTTTPETAEPSQTPEPSEPSTTPEVPPAEEPPKISVTPGTATEAPAPQPDKEPKTPPVEGPPITLNLEGVEVDEDEQEKADEIAKEALKHQLGMSKFNRLLQTDSLAAADILIADLKTRTEQDPSSNNVSKFLTNVAKTTEELIPMAKVTPEQAEAMRLRLATAVAYSQFPGEIREIPAAAFATPAKNDREKAAYKLYVDAAVKNILPGLDLAGSHITEAEAAQLLRLMATTDLYQMTPEQLAAQVNRLVPAPAAPAEAAPAPAAEAAPTGNKAQIAAAVQAAANKHNWAGTYKLKDDIISYLMVEKGVPLLQAAALAGNFQGESDYRPALNETANGIGWGLAQWSYDRRTAFENAADKAGRDRGDWKFQLDYLIAESKTRNLRNEKGNEWAGFMALKGNDVSFATRYWQWHFERPASTTGKNGADGVAEGRRTDEAEAVFIQIGAELSALQAATPAPAPAPAEAAPAAAETVNTVTLQTGTAIREYYRGKYGEMGGGRLQGEELQVLGKTWGNHKMHKDAAYAFRQLSAAFEAKFGEPFQMTDSYRSLAQQQELKARKPQLAGAPGDISGVRGSHQLGIAMDVASNADSDGTPEHEWLEQNAGKYGWELPEWARPGGSKPEPWHWEYIGGKVTVVVPADLEKLQGANPAAPAAVAAPAALAAPAAPQEQVLNLNLAAVQGADSEKKKDKQSGNNAVQISVVPASGAVAQPASAPADTPAAAPAETPAAAQPAPAETAPETAQGNASAPQISVIPQIAVVSEPTPELLAQQEADKKAAADKAAADAAAAAAAAAPAAGKIGDYEEPVPGVGVGTPFDGYQNISGTHTGSDYEGGGMEVQSVNVGKVIRADNDPSGGEGKHVVIEHPDGRRSYYMHLSSLKVSEGDNVNADTIIGISGSTGESTGPHLHLSISNPGVTVFPRKADSDVKQNFVDPAAFIAAH